MKNGKFILTILIAFFSLFAYSQTNQFTLNPQKVKMYSVYMAVRHGGTDGLEQFKASNRYDYQREMWYFTESFSIQKNYSTTGVSMDDSMIDITRFEQYRKSNEDAIVVLPGFKDALVLLAANKLIYKPNY